MGKSKSLGFQIYSALSAINMQDKEKRTEIYNNKNNTDFECVGKREFKKNGDCKQYIFSKRTAENITEKSKNFVKFLKENYSIKNVKDITPDMCIKFLESKSGSSQKTISAYKNALEKISLACACKFHIQNFYTENVREYKVSETRQTNSSRIYTNEQIEKIFNYSGKWQDAIKTMCFCGCRVSELIFLKPSDINLSKHIYTTTKKDGRIDTFSTIHIIGKGGKDSYRVILPQYRDFFLELIKDKNPDEKIFNLPKDEKETRQILSNEIRKITKELGIKQSGKNHEFRKYHSQVALQYYLSQGWSREKAEKYVIQRHLSHGSERGDLKKIYLYS